MDIQKPDTLFCATQPLDWRGAPHHAFSVLLGLDMRTGGVLAADAALTAAMQALPSGCRLDVGIPKQEAEWLLAGVVTPRAREGAVVEIRVGRSRRRFLVAASPDGSPVPLLWEKTAFDPEGNPLGGKNPQISDPALPHGAPACPLPLGAWPCRMKNMGTYDARWLKTRWPGLPDDADWRFFNEAQPQQRLPDGLRGDEEILLAGFFDDAPERRFRLPGARLRFEILRRDAHIEYLKKRLNNIDNQENLQAEFVGKVKQLEDDFAFIADCNIGDSPLTDDDIQRLEQLSKIKFIRYFNRMLGLSWAERDNIRWPELYERPSWENLLQNREDHIFGQYNRGELYNLEIRQGTINKEEREKINEHIVVTIDMLKALPFPKELSKVVEYAGAHHERIDGKGYPNGLTGDEMSVPAKIMAIADIFEALTANDRPYKEPKKLSEVLRIMQEMKNTGHIDPDLYKVFITGKVYQDYAEQYISPQQIDEINPDDYL